MAQTFLKNLLVHHIIAIMLVYIFHTRAVTCGEIPLGPSVDEPCLIRVQCQIHVFVRHRNDTNTCDIFNHFHFLKLLVMFTCQCQC